MGEAFMRFVWTVERTRQACDLWKDGYSAAEIAATIGGGLSRSAIIGKINRAGLVGQGGSQTRRSGVRRARDPNAPPRRRPARIARQNQHTDRERKAAERREIFAAEANAVIDLPDEDATNAITLFDLTAKTCRWPIGDSRSLDTIRFCGTLPHGERPYCLGHCRMAYMKPKARGEQRPFRGN